MISSSAGRLSNESGLDAVKAYPLLYQMNTRVHLTALAETLGRAGTLDDIPDAV